MRYVSILTVLYLCKSELLTAESTTLSSVPIEENFVIQQDSTTVVPVVLQLLPKERIFQGRDVELAQFKYQVLLEVSSDGKPSRCGGALISADYVLTAAHCTYGKSRVVMYFGLIYANQRDRAVQRHSAQTSIHPSFNYRTLENDISILKTNSPVQMSRNIGTISLPMQSQSSPDHFANLEAIASGWGRTTNNEEGGHSRLQWALLHMPAQRVCAFQLRQYAYNSSMNVCTDKSPIKASPCKGDSGSPLAYSPARGSPVLVGIVSWSTGDCDNELPNVYTRIAAYISYINSVTAT